MSDPGTRESDNKVLFDGSIFSQQRHGGISRYFSEVLDRLPNYPDFQISLFLHTRILGEIPGHPSVTIVQSHSLPYFRPSWAHRRCAKLVQRLLHPLQCKATKASILHPTYYGISPVKTMRYVVTVYDMIHELFPHYFPGTGATRFRRKKLEAIKAADHVFCISENTRNDVLRLTGISESKTSVVHLAASDVFRPLAQKELEGLYARGAHLRKAFLLFVGGRDHYKNFQTLLRSYGKWEGKSDFLLIAAGGSPTWTEEERALIDSLRLSKRVICLGSVPDETLAQLYNAARCFVFPSEYEGFGLPLLEAMACGTPVAAANVSSIPEVTAQAAVCFDPNSEESIRGALDTAVSTPPESDLVSRGLERVRHFSWEKTVQQMADTYRTLL